MELQSPENENCNKYNYEQYGLKINKDKIEIVRAATNGYEAINQIDMISKFYKDKMKDE